MGKRIFLALMPDEESRRKLARYAQALREPLEAYRPRWIDPGLYHLTLYFFGDVEETNLPLLEETFLDPAGSLSPPLMRLQDLLLLPSPRKPRVLTLRLYLEPPDAFDRVLKRAQAFAHAEPAPWLPHLSLARFNDHRASRGLADFLSPGGAFPKPPALTLEPTSMELMESLLSPGGPRYKILKSFGFAPKNQR
jgi:2'-5' RNA ligase